MKHLLVSSLFIISVCSSCTFFSSKRIRGNGNIKTETRSAGTFNGIDVSGAIDVYLTQDSLSSIKVETDENLLGYVDIENENGTLEIHTRSGIRLRPSRDVKVFVSNKVFRELEASGACKIYGQNSVVSDEPVRINLSGASDVEMELRASKIDVDASGAGNVLLRGSTKEFSVEGTGSTSIKCFDLLTESSRIELSGAGDAEITASAKLDVHIYGAADVRYKGNASVTQSISGAGSIKKIE